MALHDHSSFRKNTHPVFPLGELLRIGAFIFLFVTCGFLGWASAILYVIDFIWVGYFDGASEMAWKCLVSFGMTFISFLLILAIPALTSTAATGARYVASAVKIR
jgi:hypothetical protein